MPLARYFAYVGGVLLALLFIADFCLPKLPPAEATDPHFPRILISSERKWPERVVFDTSIQMNVPARPTDLLAESPVPAVSADVSAKAREAFAQLQPSSTNAPRPSDRTKRGSKPQRQFNLARRSVAPVIRVARHPQFGWFGLSIW
jgi:hypothetical protein